MYKSLRLLLILLVGSGIGAIAQTMTFSSSGGPYAYTVPAGVTGVTVNVKGASGGLNSDEVDAADSVGHGGCVQAVIAVTPGQVLQVYVGGCGGIGTATTGGTGGVNGGGNGSNYTSTFSGGGGGGYSDVRLFAGTLSDRLVVAGGGGGAAANCGFLSENGGDGGPSTGGATGGGCSPYTGGVGGSAGAGGAGGSCSGGCLGSAGVGGTPSTGGAGGAGTAGGGGGGGYGGGGGGQFSGGGGGGNYAAGPGVTMLSDTRGCNTSCGIVTIAVSCVAGSISGPNHVCSGSTTAALTATVTGGTWSSSNPAVATVSSSGAITGVNAGLDTVIYTIDAHCKTTYAITVNPLPEAITSRTASYFVCQHDTLTLSDASTGGTWISTATTKATIGSVSGLVTGISAGSTTIIFRITATGCAASQTLNVGAVPTAILGADSACIGATVGLSDLTASGVWSSSNTTVATIGSSTGFVSALSGTPPNDTTTITYTEAGCKATVIFTVNPNPSAITGPSNICMGTTAADTSTPSGGTWSITSGTGSGTVDPVTGVITPASVGTVFLAYTLPTGCNQLRVINILAATAPITTTSTGVECAGTATITLSDLTSGGTWSSVNTAIATVSSTGVVSAAGGSPGGRDTIEYTHAGCISMYVVTVNPKPAVVTTTSASICVGDCSEVFSDVTASGVWSTSAVAIGTIDPSSGTFCALSAGTLTVIYTNTVTTCFRAKAVTVNALPAAIGVVAPAPGANICLGSSISLTESTAGGTWSTTSTNVTLGGSTGSPLSVSGDVLGTADITYTTAEGCVADIVVTVNALPNPVASPDSVFCVGQSSSVTSLGSLPGTWSSSNPGAATVGSSSGIVTGVPPGGVTEIIYTLDGSGCTSQIQMTINGLPTLTFPSGPSTCVASPVYTVTASGGAGNWSSRNVAVATATNSPTPPAGLITAVSPGLDSICFTLVLSGCRACRQFTVNAAPGPIAPSGGSHSICTGATLTLSDPTTPGGTWSSSTGAATVGSSSGVVTGVTTTGSPTTITYTTGVGCDVSTVVSVNQSPAPITGSTSICQGLTTALATTGPGGFGWNWASSNSGVAPIVAAGLTATVTGSAAGTSTISYSNSFTGCSTSILFTVTSFSTPISGSSNVCTGTTATETETTSGTWSIIGTAASAFAGPSAFTIVNPISPGAFTLVFTTPSGCEVSKSMTVNAVPSAIVTPLSSLNLCPGGFVELTASTGAGYSYQWNNAGVIPGETNSTYRATAAGTYAVTVFYGPCQATSTGDAVTMNPATAVVFPTGATSTCASTGVTLDGFFPPTPIPGYSYQWLRDGVPVAGATDSAYTPTTSGDYTVAESNSFGCSATSGPAITVSLSASPAGTATASGLLNFCAGGHVILTGDAGAGYTYQWYRGSLASPIPGATNQSYTATTTGSYFVIDFNTTGCSTQSGAIAVVVSPLPVATVTAASDTIFCTGGSVALAAPAVAGNTFQWYDGGVAIAGATSVVYTASVTGHYTVMVDSPAGGTGGCSTLSPAKSVTVVTTPRIEPITPTSFCWGSSADLAVIIVGGAGAVTYQWSDGGVNIPGATGSSYNATASGAYACAVSVSSGLCVTTSLAVTVSENPLPNPAITYDGTHLHAQIYFTSYTWYFNGAVMPGATTSTISPIGNGTYKVRVIDTNGCQSVSAGYIVSGWVAPRTTGVSNASGNSMISIYPNPAQTTVHIDAPIDVRAVISSVDGRTLIDMATAKDIDVSRLVNGIYTIQLFDASGQMVKAGKLVKE